MQGERSFERAIQEVLLYAVWQIVQYEMSAGRDAHSRHNPLGFGQQEEVLQGPPERFLLRGFPTTVCRRGQSERAGAESMRYQHFAFDSKPLWKFHERIVTHVDSSS